MLLTVEITKLEGRKKMFKNTSKKGNKNEKYLFLQNMFIYNHFFVIQ